VVASGWFVAVCAHAAPAIHAVASKVIARHLKIMMFLHFLQVCTLLERESELYCSLGAIAGSLFAPRPAALGIYPDGLFVLYKLTEN
jgi:hypothetical protein